MGITIAENAKVFKKCKVPSHVIIFGSIELDGSLEIEKVSF